MSKKETVPAEEAPKSAEEGKENDDPLAGLEYEGTDEDEPETVQDDKLNQNQDDDADDDDDDEGDADADDTDADDANKNNDDADEGGEDEDDGDKKENPAKKPKKSVAERIAEITKKRRDAERAAEQAANEKTALAEENRILKQKLGLTDDETGDKSQDGPKAPDPKDFEYGEYDQKFREAEREYIRQSTIAAVRAEQDENRQSEAAERQAQERKALLDTQIEAGVTKYEDYEEVVLEGVLNDLPPPSEEAADLILKSEHGADLMYHFAQNPDEVRAMTQKSPLEQAQYIGKLEARFSAAEKPPAKKKKAKPSKAPEPITRARGGGGRFAKSDDDSDFLDFEKKYNKPKG